MQVSSMPTPCIEYHRVSLRWYGSLPVRTLLSYYSNAFLCAEEGKSEEGFVDLPSSVRSSVQMRPLVMLHINDIRMTACSTAATGFARDGRTDAANGGHNNTDSPLTHSPVLGGESQFPSPSLLPPQDAAAITSVRSTLGSRTGERQLTPEFKPYY